MKRFIPFFIAIFAALLACTKHSTGFERRLAVADSLMTHEMPDSAYRMLCGMDAEAEEVSGPLRMRHLLLRSNAQNKAYVDFTSDSIGTLLVDYYEQHGTPNERMLAHYMKGCAYRDMQDQPAALRCYNDAVAAADTSMADCNYNQLSIIYQQIAKIFNDRAMPDNALQSYEMAEHCAWKAQDSIGVFTIRGNKSNALINQGKIQEALRIKEAAAEGFRTMGYPQKAARVRGLCIKWYARQGEFDKAKEAMDDYENLSGYFLKNGEAKPGYKSYYHIKGTYYLEKGILDSAEHYFQKLQTEGETVNDRYLASWGLSQLYKKTGLKDSVAKYAFLNSIQNDSIYNEQTAQKLQNAQAQYNYTRHLETAHRKELEAKDARYRLLLLGCTCMLAITLLALLVLWMRKQNQKKQQELSLANKANAQLHSQIQVNAQTIEELNGLIAGLNDVISKNAADLQLKEKLEQSVNILEEKLETYRKEKEIHSQTHELNKLLQDPIVKRILEMGRIRKDYPSYNDWHILYTLMEEYYPKLAELRKDTNMLEYQICVLTKLGCKLSDIAHLTQTSNNNLAVIRGRMLKKIFHINEGGTKMFDQMVKEL